MFSLRRGDTETGSTGLTGWGGNAEVNKRRGYEGISISPSSWNSGIRRKSKEGVK